VKLTDISTRLGLSVSTVSRALRNAEGVDAQTRSRVLAAASQAGYRGASRLRRGKSGRTRTILVLSRNEAGVIGYDAMAGMSRAAVDLNVSILSHQTPQDLESILNPRLQPPALRAGQVDGIILLHEWPAALVADLRQLQPVVSLLHSYEGVDMIGVCALQGMELLVSHLAAGGSSSIGFLGGRPETAAARLQSAAFHAACRVCGIGGNDVGACGSEALREAADMARGGVTSWICADARPARALTEHLAGCGLPAAVQLAVFTPSSAQPARSPRWTSLKICADDLGIAAVRRLIRRIDCPAESPRSVLLRAGLSRGETTRDPAHSPRPREAVPPARNDSRPF
jgi:LacI family transcriptional regulator